MKRMIQVKTKSPMKILFCGLISNVILSNLQISKSERDDPAEATHTYFNKFWYLSPLKFGGVAVFQNVALTRKRKTGAGFFS